MVAKAAKIGSLYQLDCKLNCELANVATKSDSKVDLWHKKFGHLGVGSLQRLVREQLADSFDFDASQQLTFCEMCPHGKQHRVQVFYK